LAGHKQADLQADVVGGEHFLAGDGVRDLAQVVRRDLEVAAPADVASRLERRRNELAVVVEQARVAVRDSELVAALAEQLCDNGRHDADGDGEEESDFELHVFLLSVLSHEWTRIGGSQNTRQGADKEIPFASARVIRGRSHGASLDSCSFASIRGFRKFGRGRAAALRQRGKHSWLPAKPLSSCARAGRAAPGRWVWESNPLSFHSVLDRVRFSVAFWIQPMRRTTPAMQAGCWSGAKSEIGMTGRHWR